MIVLRELNLNDEDAFYEGMRDWKIENLSWYTFDWKPGMEFSDLIKQLANNKLGIGIPKDHVPSTMLYGFFNGKIVGRLNIRHHLNEFLRHRGGHVGYAIAEKYRGKGFATEMVKQSLPICRSLGIKDILITCDDSNIPSWKIIERFNGKLIDKVMDEQKKVIMRRYGITLY